MKQCRKCLVSKFLQEFYMHKQMGDGHLNICKECVKERVRNFGRSPAGREYDRERFKKKKRKKWIIRYQRIRRAREHEKFLARGRLSRAVKIGKIIRKVCQKCGDPKVQGHHPDYSKPLEVIWLCGVHHRELHKQYQRKS